MATQHYTTRDLLRLRGQSVGGEHTEGLRNRLFSNPELGRSQIFGRSVFQYSDINRDEIARTSRDRRLARIPEDTREKSAVSEERPTVKQNVVRQLDGTESDWHYRVRSESGDAQPQPIPAPSGLTAQRHEGFQRFYRAVVSPTHVRVTAGGRIVPNNRGTSSPTTKWDKDKPLADPMSTAQSSDRLPPQPAPGFAYAPVPYGGFSPMYPGFVPGVNHGIPPPHPAYAYVPWQMGGTMPMPIATDLRTVNDYRGQNFSKDSSQSDKRSESGTSEKAHRSRSSRPEQFDASQISMYQGPWLIPPAAAFYHYGMGPPPGYPPGTLNAPATFSHGLPVRPSGPPAATKTGQSVENEAPVRSSTNMPASAEASTMPPVTSIRSSEITAKHLGILRQRLKFCEDQLQYNRHQIDEYRFSQDAASIRQQIEVFEKTREQQLVVEEAQYPKSTRKSAVTKPEGTNCYKGWYYGANATFGGAFSKSADRIMEKPQFYNNPNKKAAPRTKYGNKSTKLTSTFPHWNNRSDSTTAKGRRSGLPAGAALAAPFQPRGSAVTPSMAQSADSSRRSVISSAELDLGFSYDGPYFVSNGRLNWDAFHLAYPDHNGPSAPYLIGHVPPNMKPEAVLPHEYIYGRELTEEELRARHMYWGNAPRHFQNGLPKFNGKDFFPPSPVKHQSSNETWSSKMSNHPTATRPDGLETKSPDRNADDDPFHALGLSGSILTRNGPGNSTQSEALPGLDGTAMGSTPAQSERTEVGIGRVGRSLDEFKRSSFESIQTSSNVSKDKSSSDDVEEEQKLLFVGRRSMSRAK